LCEREENTDDFLWVLAQWAVFLLESIVPVLKETLLGLRAISQKKNKKKTFSEQNWNPNLNPNFPTSKNPDSRLISYSVVWLAGSLVPWFADRMARHLSDKMASHKFPTGKQWRRLDSFPKF
jgi:hypothetical protein